MKSTQSVYLSPGDTIRLKVEIEPENSHGLYPRIDDVTIDFIGTSVKLVTGFRIEKDDVGTLTATAEKETSVKYTHNKPENNRIWFYALTDEVIITDVISVPIHDHSSIVRGGPAYGTYFSDDEVAS